MVYDNVRIIRLAKGISKTKVAAALNLSPMGYTHVERGGKLTADRLKVIAGVLGEDVSVFYDDKLTKSVAKSYLREMKRSGNKNNKKFSATRQSRRITNGS